MESSNPTKYWITSENEKTIKFIRTSYGYGASSANVHIEYIQLEEGTVPTKYKPFTAINSMDVVTLQKEQTLTAIWMKE